MKLWCLLSSIDDLLGWIGEKFLVEAMPGFKKIPIDYVNALVDGEGELKVYFRGKKLELPDMFWPAVSNTNTFSLEKLLVDAGVKCAINLDEVIVARSKIATYRRLSKNGIRVPKTMVLFSHSNKASILEQFDYPFVMKPDNSTDGKDVKLINNEKELDAYISKQTYGVAHMAQEYISTSFGKDMRVVMLYGKLYYSAIRNSDNPDEFRSNVYYGGSTNGCPIDDDTEKFCEKIASLFDLPLLGINLLFGQGEYVVVEVNPFPEMYPEIGKKAYKTLINNFNKDFYNA